MEDPAKAAGWGGKGGNPWVKKNHAQTEKGGRKRQAPWEKKK